MCMYQEAIMLDPDRHCLGINQTNPVPADCCGFCFLSNIHLSRLFNCTGMQDILKNDEAIKVLSGLQHLPCTLTPCVLRLAI